MPRSAVRRARRATSRRSPARRRSRAAAAGSARRGSCACRARSRSRARAEPRPVVAADRRQRPGRVSVVPCGVCSTPRAADALPGDQRAVDRRVGRAADRRGERARACRAAPRTRRARARPGAACRATCAARARAARARGRPRRCRAAARSTAPAARARAPKASPTATPNAGLPAATLIAASAQTAKLSTKVVKPSPSSSP